MYHNLEIKDSALLIAMFESAGEGLVVVDREGIIRLINPRITEMFQFSSEELLNQPIEVLIPSSKRSAHKGQRNGYMEHPRKRTMGTGMDLSGQRKDGSTFPIEVSLNNFRDDGKMYVMAMVTDISIRKQAEKEIQQMNQRLETEVESRTNELRESQILYSEIARNFPKGTINVFDEKLNYVFVEGEDLYKAGITSKRLVGTNYIRHLPIEVRDFIQSELQEVFQGKKKSLEVTIPKGTYLLNCAPLQNLGGEINQILVVEQNITQQKEAESDAKNALEKEKELSELKSRFVSMASHEFRTPLSTILSSSNLISKYPKEDQLEKREKHIKRIQSNVRNLTGILNDFLSISKLEEGKIVFRPSDLELHRLLEELAEEMQEIARPGQRIELNCQSNIAIKTDIDQLKNVLINLISNAIKYSREGDVIELRCNPEGDEVRIDVEDHGIGIPEEEQGKMFERFFRANNATNIQGTGLGLYIVKRYAEQLGGSISFTSEYEKGSIFTLRIPKITTHGEEDIAD
jgi:PAS domain S-box-containing protein